MVIKRDPPAEARIQVAGYAAANYYLAAPTAASFPLLTISGEAPRLGARAVAHLERAESEHPNVSDLLPVQDRWSTELAPARIPVEA